MNFIKKNKSLVIVLISLIILIIINYFIGVRNLSKNEINEINTFSFWRYSFQHNLGTLIIVLVPLLIAIAVVLPFFQKMKSGFIQYIVVRTPYKKYITKEIKRTYLKSILLFPLISVLLIGIGTLVFGTKPSYVSGYITGFNIANPFLYVLKTTIGMILYGIININLTLILSRYINKFYLVLIALFLSIFFIGFFEANYILTPIRNILNIKSYLNSSYFDLFFNSLSRPNWIEIYILGILRIIITTIPVYFIYRSQENLVIKNEE